MQPSRPRTPVTMPMAPPTMPPPTVPPPTVPPPAVPPPAVPPPTTPPPTVPTVPEPPDPVDPVDPPDPPVTIACPDPIFGQAVAFAQSEIDALAGCEGLYGLWVYGALDLRPLASLRRVGEGGLYLQYAGSLEGLEGLEEAFWMSLYGESIQSLLPLAGLRRVENLSLTYTGLVDLSGIENVSGIRSLNAYGNNLLGSLQGLAVEPEMTEVAVQGNTVLYDISSLSRIEGLNRLYVGDNPVLTQIHDFERLVRLGGVALERNFNLLAAPQFPLLTSINELTVVDHPMLERLTGFAALETASYISISANPNLVELDLSHLRQAQTLIIFDNSRLDGAALASNLAGVESLTHRVAPDQTQAVLNPCPWTTDNECDWLCEWGTDPVCF